MADISDKPRQMRQRPRSSTSPGRRRRTSEEASMTPACWRRIDRVYGW